MAERHLFVVLTNAVEGQEDAYNDWYTHRHLVDVVAIPGIVSARRYELSEAQLRSRVPYAYCALYEIETDDLEVVLAELRSRAGTEAMPITTAIARERVAIIYKAIEGAAVEQDHARPGLMRVGPRITRPLAP